MHTLHRRLRDPGQRVPEAARRRAGVPARVGRARAPGALLDDRRPPAGGDPGRRRRPGGDRRRRGGARRSTPPTPSARWRTPSTRVGMAPPPEPLAFWGGAVGYFGYDLVRTVERLPDAAARRPRRLPDLVALVTGPVRGLRPPAPLADDRGALPARPGGRPRGAPTGARWRPCPSSRARLSGPVPPRARARGRAGARPGHQQLQPRGLRGRRRAGPRVHLRRRRLPDRARRSASRRR